MQTKGYECRLHLHVSQLNSPKGEFVNNHEILDIQEFMSLVNVSTGSLPL